MGELKDEYDKFIASDEGVAKLKAFKEAQQEAKAQFVPRADAQEGSAETEEVSPEKTSPKKREAANEKIAPPAKRGRGAKISTCEEPSIPEDVLKEAEHLGMVSQLKNLAARADVAAAGKTPRQLLSVLMSSGGLVIKAK